MLGERLVVRDQHPAAACRGDLVAVEREGADAADRPGLPPGERPSDQPAPRDSAASSSTATPCRRTALASRARSAGWPRACTTSRPSAAAPGGRPAVELGGEQGRVHVPGAVVGVHEHGSRALVPHRVRRAHEGEVRDQHVSRPAAPRAAAARRGWRRCPTRRRRRAGSRRRPRTAPRTGDRTARPRSTNPESMASRTSRARAHRCSAPRAGSCGRPPSSVVPRPRRAASTRARASAAVSAQALLEPDRGRPAEPAWPATGRTAAPRTSEPAGRIRSSSVTISAARAGDLQAQLARPRRSSRCVPVPSCTVSPGSRSADGRRGRTPSQVSVTKVKSRLRRGRAQPSFVGAGRAAGTARSGSPPAPTGAGRRC